MEEVKPIKKVTPILLELACRMVGVSITIASATIIIGIVELIEEKGGDVTMRDVLSLKEMFESQQNKTK